MSGSLPVPLSGSSGSVWARFEHDPRDPGNGALRASNLDRDVVNDVLAGAYADGRLTPEEFDVRTTNVNTAKTLAELPSILEGLVATSGLQALDRGSVRSEAEHRYVSARRNALLSFLTPTLITWVIYLSLLAGGGGTAFPWPVFVTIGTGMPLLRIMLSRADMVRSLERKVERDHVRELESRERRRREKPN